MRTFVQPAALVQAWLDTLRPEQQRTATALAEATLAAEPALVRTIKWGNLVFLHRGVHAVAVVAHRDHASFQVFNGAVLKDAFPMLLGSGTSMRHLKFRHGEPVDAAPLMSLVRARIEQLTAGAG